MKKKLLANLILGSLTLNFAPICGAQEKMEIFNICEDYTQSSDVINSENQKSINIAASKTISQDEHLLNVVNTAAKASEQAYDLLNCKKENHCNCVNPFGNVNGVRAGFVRKAFIDGKPYIIVALHGTANGDDAVTDANAIFGANCPFLKNSSVHKGFYDRYAMFREEMINEVKAYFGELHSKDTKILVTGHSLGGALATLAALELEQELNFKGRVQMVTFCSPRVLSPDAHKIASEIIPEDKNRALRVWRIGDTVAKVGMGSMGYKHFGESWALSKAPKEGIAGYLDILSWHSITTMAKDMEELKDKKLNFNDNIKVNSKHAVLSSVHTRAYEALKTSYLGNASKSVINVGKAIGSKLCFWK